jgi:hypothetical protein
MTDGVPVRGATTIGADVGTRGRPESWLLLCAGDDRQHAGNEGYDDQPDAYYSWDSTVPNHARVSLGDRIVLWDKKWLLGASVIEEILTATADKRLRRCPRCGSASIKERRSIEPRYRCQDCRAEFGEPTEIVRTVTTYRCRHDGGWAGLEGALSGAQLRSLAESPNSQHSLRPFRWDAFADAVRAVRGPHGLDTVGRRADALPAVTVRVRPGGRELRRQLLRTDGECCVLTGPAPEAALDAGELYSYTSLGGSEQHGGLLLRRDLRRLLDNGQLALQPLRRELDVSAELRAFPQYAQLQGAPIAGVLAEGPAAWVELHWDQHRRGL